MLDCRCCDVVDFRGDYETQRATREELSLGLDDLPEELSRGHATKYDRHDRGTWELFVDGSGKVGIISSDSKHDVILYVTGDFFGKDIQMEYASLIAGRLNLTIPTS